MKGVEAGHDDVVFVSDTRDVNWTALKQRLHEDRFDNGRTPEQLRASFENSAAVCFAVAEEGVIGKARLLSDGVCNAYIVDVWTWSPYRRRGIASSMVRALVSGVPGQHVYLQTEPENQEFYRGLGFSEQPVGMSLVSGAWLNGARSTTGRLD